MTPVSQTESSSHGGRSLSRIPLVVAGPVPGLKRGAIDTLAQQADLRHSLLSLTSNSRCRLDGRGDVLAQAPIEPHFVAHVRGDHRSWVNIYTPVGDGIVQLDGDNTRWISPGQLDDKIITQINADRLALGEAVQDKLEYMMELRQGKRTF